MGTLYLSQAIGGRVLYLYRVLHWGEIKRIIIPKKDVFSRVQATTESSAYSDFPREHVIICRLTSAEKAYLYGMDNAQQIVDIIENSISYARCWIDKIKVEYEIVEYADSPWKVSIFLVEVGIGLLDADIEIDIAVSIEPPIWIVWHPAVSIEPPLWIVWHPVVSDEPNIEVSLHSAYSDETRIHAGLLSAYISGNDAFWAGVGYPSAC